MSALFPPAFIQASSDDNGQVVILSVGWEEERGEHRAENHDRRRSRTIPGGRTRDDLPQSASGRDPRRENGEDLAVPSRDAG